MSRHWEPSFRDAGISDLLGKTMLSVTVNDDNDEIAFVASDGSEYLMYHQRDCCEQVSIAEIIGDLKDLVGSPIVEAEETSNHETSDYESTTWTFYKLGTEQGFVTLRWCGTSNGYYSESVDFARTKDPTTP